MLVTDLHHFLDLPEDTPGPARRLAEHLSNIVRAATAGDADTAWEVTVGPVWVDIASSRSCRPLSMPVVCESSCLLSLDRLLPEVPTALG
jgi:hypothetical protein